ncbi:hypothetical protein AA313_de0207714 [Arthrobotrys entomopaga]|nr:hypothetical protein AA313_de0207714 [Arthrobotrys entomopaga]
MIKLSRYAALHEMRPLTENVQKAIPKIEPFWLHPIVSIDNYDENLWDYVRDGTIEVIRDTIESVQGDFVTLKSRYRFPTDAVILATGFRARIPFFEEDPKLEMQLGLPCPSHNYTEEYIRKWNTLEAEADEKVFALNPLLKEAPVASNAPPHFGPFRLYHWTVPTEFADDSIAIMGAHMVTGTIHYAIVKSAWTVAYMTGKLQLPSKEEMEKAAAYELRFSQICYLGQGNSFPLTVADWTSILSMLLKELGFSGKLKKTWFAEIFQRITCKDIVGITREWISQNRIES